MFPFNLIAKAVEYLWMRKLFWEETVGSGLTREYAPVTGGGHTTYHLIRFPGKFRQRHILRPWPLANYELVTSEHKARDQRDFKKFGLVIGDPIT